MIDINSRKSDYVKKTNLESSYEEANELYHKIIVKLSSIPEILAIWLFGSFVDGSNDDKSDLDFKISIKKEFYDQHGFEGFDKLIQAIQPVLIYRSAKFSDYTIFCHYTGVPYTLRVDYHFYFDTQPIPRKHEKCKLLFNRVKLSDLPKKKQRSFLRGTKIHPEELIRRFWLKQMFNLKYIPREELWMALSFINSERNHLITIFRNIYTPNSKILHARNLKQDIPSEILSELEKMVVSYDKDKMIEATLASFRLMEDYVKPKCKEFNWEYPDKVAREVQSQFLRWLSSSNVS